MIVCHVSRNPCRFGEQFENSDDSDDSDSSDDFVNYEDFDKPSTSAESRALGHYRHRAPLQIW